VAIRAKEAKIDRSAVKRIALDVVDVQSEWLSEPHVHGGAPRADCFDTKISESSPEYVGSFSRTKRMTQNKDLVGSASAIR
jgi:hypothetical protein